MNQQKLVTATAPTSTTGSAGAARPMTPLDTTTIHPVVGGSIDSVRQEVDDAFADMRTFHTREPDEIMRMAGGHSARISELRVRVMRVEDFARQWKDVRIRELEPTLTELQNQFSIASRLHSVRQLDYEMEAGQHS